jgi:hypothetical protein
MAGRSRQRIPEAEWSLRRTVIETSYIEEDKSLAEVLDVLKTDHNFIVRYVSFLYTSVLRRDVVIDS